MITLFIVVIPFVIFLIRLVLYLIVRKFGKFSYDGFSAAGFAYHSKKDLFYSTKNAWQKNFGYTHMYDVFAPIFRMIIDTESIRFNYNNKNWLISFWKGQYGMVTGAEIGIYRTTQNKVNKKTVYLPASDSEMLKMDLVLYKNDEIIAKVRAKHWWLAVFKLGMFSKPKELKMDIKITFPEYQMLEAFLKAFKKLGYKDKDFKVENSTFYFKFVKPRTRKVWTRIWLFDSIRQFFNRKNVELYNKYLVDFIDDNRIDDSKIVDNQDVIILNDLIPKLLKNKSEKEKPYPQLINNMYDKKAKNVILLNSNVYSGTEENNYE